MTDKDRAAKALADLQRQASEFTATPAGAEIAVGRVVLHLLSTGEQIGTGAIIVALQAAEAGDLKGVLQPSSAKGALDLIRQLRPELVSR